MGYIQQQLEETLKMENMRLKDDEAFQAHIEYIDDLKKQGIIKKTSYRFPPMDTVGRNLKIGRPRRSLF